MTAKNVGYWSTIIAGGILLVAIVNMVFAAGERIQRVEDSAKASTEDIQEIKLTLEAMAIVVMEIRDRMPGK